jgi:glycosyltransferase involved in cell wall biosynthesis
MEDLHRRCSAGGAAAEPHCRVRTVPDVLVVSSEALGERPAGPALRVAGLAHALAARGLDVTVAAPAGSRPPEGCSLAALDDLERLAPACRSAVVSGFQLERHPALERAPALCVDLAGPFLLENLVVHAARPPGERRAVLVAEADVAARLLASADLLLCAHGRQRDLLVGMLLGRALLRPELLDHDPPLDRLIAVVPFGAPEGEPPPRSAPTPGALRLVWPGGLWDWLDPLTLVEGLARARGAGADVTLELWGTRSPDPLVPPPRAATALRGAVERLGLAQAVELVEWVPFAERLQRLARAHVAVTLDDAGLEARYAFRTRLLDALWAGVPTLATAGEAVADEAAAVGAGWTLPAHDTDAVASLLERLAGDAALVGAAAERAPEVAARYRYEELVEPLARWCAAPVRRRPGVYRQPLGARIQRIASSVRR